MASDLKRYLVKCNDVSHPDLIETAWLESEPAVCPLNALHTIDTAQTTEIEAKSSIERIVTDKHPSGNFPSYRAEGHNFACPSAATTNYVIRWPWDVQVFDFLLFPQDANNDDSYQLRGMTAIAIGAVTANAATDDTVISVSPTVFIYIRMGYKLHIHSAAYYDLDNETEIANDTGGSETYLNPTPQGGVFTNYITDYDSAAGTVTLKSGLSAAITAGNGIRLVVDRGCNVPVRLNCPVDFGGSITGGTVTTKGTMIEAIYTNVGGSPTECAFVLETRIGNAKP